MKSHWFILALAVPLLAQPQATFSVDVNLVRVPCVVTRANGAPVLNLSKEDFIVLEDGKPQEVKYLWQELDLPLTVILVVDVACHSLANNYTQEIVGFLDHALSPGDRVAIVAVTDQARVVTDLTGSKERVRSGAETLRQVTDSMEKPSTSTMNPRRLFGPTLGDPCVGSVPGPWSDSAFPCGPEVLWNAVFFSSRLGLRPQTGRKALLLITGGLDTGSDHNLEEAIGACQSADTLVYSIRYLNHFSLTQAPVVPEGQARAGILEPRASPVLNSRDYWISREKPNLDQISRQTGGLAFDAKNTKLADVLDRIQADLRSQYVLGFVPSSVHNPRGFHKLQVKVTAPGLKVRAQDRYYSATSVP